MSVIVGESWRECGSPEWRERSVGEEERGRRREGFRGAMSRNGSEILFAGVSMGGRERDREQASL